MFTRTAAMHALSTMEVLSTNEATSAAPRASIATNPARPARR